MAKYDLNVRPSFTANLPKTVHNLSKSDSFTMIPSAITPVDWDYLNPGESIRFNTNFVGYLQPVVTQALVDCDVVVDHFFVPFSMIFNYFPSWFTQTNDMLSSTQYSEPLYQLPVFDFVFENARINLGSPERFNIDAGSMSGQADFKVVDGFDNYFRSQFRLLERFGYNPFVVFSNLEYGALRGLKNEQGTEMYNEELERVADDFVSSYIVNGSTSGGSDSHLDVLPWNLYAYQAVYNWFYLDEERERRDVCNYNIDIFANRIQGADIIINNSDNYAFDCNPLYLRYHRRVLDYFMSTKNNPISSWVNMLDGQNDSQNKSYDILKQVQNYLGGSNSIFANATETQDVLASDITQIGSSFSPQIGSYISTAQLRSMFAVEKLMRIQGRAAKSYDAQVLAHFGYKVPHDVMHQITHIHSDRGTLQIRNITNMAESDAAALGERGGQGQFVVNGSEQTFTAPCHGCYLAVAYIIPHVRYQGTYDKRNKMFEWTDFYHPEYDNLGMQPLFRYEVDNTMVGSKGSQRIGWQYRYEQFKRRYDTASIAFAQARPFDDVQMEGTNLWSPWMITQTPFNNVLHNVPNKYVQPSDFFATPCDLNQIMEIPFSPTMTPEQVIHPWLMFQGDPFIVTYHSSLRKISTMSQYGEPKLDS